jgi:hypothetical protein
MTWSIHIASPFKPVSLPIALEFIQSCFKDRVSKRSREPYMRHITEGLQILDLLGADEFTRVLFCLHPLYQMEKEWEEQKSALARIFPMSVHAAGFDYHCTANSCLPRTGRQPVLSRWHEVNVALVADKAQNYAAFLRTIAGTHPDADELHRYFRAWISKLQGFGASLELVDILSNPWSIPMDELVSSVEGEFGAERTYDVHTGLDLYAPVDTPVWAMRAGQVINVGQFTGAEVGSPWWNRTEAVVVDHGGIYVTYGEIEPACGLGDIVRPGDVVGWVRQVLRTYKGRPMSMLHLEVATSRVNDLGATWDLGQPRPPYLLNPKGLVKYEIKDFSSCENCSNRGCDRAGDHGDVPGGSLPGSGLVSSATSDAVQSGEHDADQVW